MIADEKEQHGVLISVIAVLSLIVMVVAVSFAAFTFSKGGTKENVITSGTVEFIYSEDSPGISITNAMPISDDLGKVIEETNDDNIAQGYFDFSIHATVGGSAAINYEIYGLNVTEGNNKLDTRYVKVYLTDGGTPDEKPYEGYNGSIVPTYEALENSKSNLEGKKLYEGTFVETATHNFRLRLWVADSYTVSGNENRFKMKVNVEAGAA